MNRSIIQTALINKSLPLELDYRKPSMREGEFSFDDLAEVRFAPPRADQPLSYEFACLLQVI